MWAFRWYQNRLPWMTLNCYKCKLSNKSHKIGFQFIQTHSPGGTTVLRQRRDIAQTFTGAKMLSPVCPSVRLSHRWISQKTVEVRIMQLHRLDHQDVWRYTAFVDA